MSAPQQVPLKISIAPFPEGWEGDLDEHGQQLVQLMEAYVEGNFLTGLILPPGSTLPTTDQGPIAMGGAWYFYDPVSGKYLPQSISAKAARNYAKNAIYQVQQISPSFTLGAADTGTYDMVLSRATVANVLAIANDVGPPASADSDNCPYAIKYTVGPSLVATPASTDRFVHEHLIEASDIAMLQGETLTLGFSVWTNVPGTYSVYLCNGARDASFVSNFVVQTGSVWQRVRVTGIPAMPVGTIGTWTNWSEGATGLRIGVVLAIGSQFQTAATNTNKWIAGAFYGTASNSNLCTVVNNQFKISAVKLEASPSATYCTVNSFEQDFHDAIRYYWTSFNYQALNAGTATQATAWGTNGVVFTQAFPRRMAKVPTVVPYGWASYSPGKVTNISTANTDNAIATLGATQKGVVSGLTTVTAAKGDVFAAFLTADARLT
jgi:hypothetical protein